MPLPQQIKKIWAAAREAHVDEPGLRDLVANCSAKHQTSIRALTVDEANRVIDALVVLGASSSKGGRGAAGKPSGRRKASGEIQMITPGQVEEITRRRQQLGGLWLEDRYFAGACRKRLKKDRPTTAGDATKVIEMLKKRIANDAERRAAGE